MFNWDLIHKFSIMLLVIAILNILAYVLDSCKAYKIKQAKLIKQLLEKLESFYLKAIDVFSEKKIFENMLKFLADHHVKIYCVSGNSGKKSSCESGSSTSDSENNSDEGGERLGNSSQGSLTRENDTRSTSSTSCSSIRNGPTELSRRATGEANAGENRTPFTCDNGNSPSTGSLVGFAQAASSSHLSDQPQQTTAAATDVPGPSWKKSKMEQDQIRDENGEASSSVHHETFNSEDSSEDDDKEVPSPRAFQQLQINSPVHWLLRKRVANSPDLVSVKTNRLEDRSRLSPGSPERTPVTSSDDESDEHNLTLDENDQTNSIPVNTEAPHISEPTRGSAEPETPSRPLRIPDDVDKCQEFIQGAGLIATGRVDQSCVSSTTPEFPQPDDYVTRVDLGHAVDRNVSAVPFQQHHPVRVTEENSEGHDPNAEVTFAGLSTPRLPDWTLRLRHFQHPCQTLREILDSLRPNTTPRAFYSRPTVSVTPPSNQNLLRSFNNRSFDDRRRSNRCAVCQEPANLEEAETCRSCHRPICAAHINMHRWCNPCGTCSRQLGASPLVHTDTCTLCSQQICAMCRHLPHVCGVQVCALTGRRYRFPLGYLVRCLVCFHPLCFLCGACHRCPRYPRTFDDP